MPNSKLPYQPYTSLENVREASRFFEIVGEVEEYYGHGIQRTIEKHAEIMREEIKEGAPYDFQELDDYHMKDHMIKRNFYGVIEGQNAIGQEVESEAPYSGLLEYGVAKHGVQYVFFRPVVERGQKEFKIEVIKEMKAILKK